MTRRLCRVIAKVLCERLAPGLDPGTVFPDTGLFGSGVGIDSISRLELVLGLEEALGIEIDEFELNAEALASVGSLALFLERRIEACGGGSGGSGGSSRYGGASSGDGLPPSGEMEASPGGTDAP